MTDAVATASSGATGRRSPAQVERATVDGLAVLRRRRDDIDPALPTVVLVHGAMDRAASFGRVMRRLVEYDVIAYDRRGYAGSLSIGADEAAPVHEGGSSRGAIYANADDLRAVIQWSGCAHAVVVGHSLGGTVAMALAAGPVDEHRDRGVGEHGVIERGVGERGEVVSLGVFESPAPWLDGSFSDVGRGAIDVAEADGAEAAAEYFYKLMIGDQTFSRLRDRDRQARRAEGPALVAELRALRDPSLAVDLSAVDLPTIVGNGSTSSPSLRHGAALVMEAITDAWGVEIAGAGHGAHLTHPDEFASYVRACVARGEVEIERRSGEK